MTSRKTRVEVAEEGIARHDPLWPAQATILAAILLYFALPEKVTVGPTWVLPSVEMAALAGLVLATPKPHGRHARLRRHLAMGLVGVVSAVTLVSLVLLVHYLVVGGRATGRPLIAAGLVLWATNVLLFALWYYELDRGGPVARPHQPEENAAFLFPQMTDSRFAAWRPRFVDYLYVSLTNATAFSPTDTMPLTPGAKGLMGLQAIASLATIGLVVARAVNILS